MGEVDVDALERLKSDLAEEAQITINEKLPAKILEMEKVVESIAAIVKAKKVDIPSTEELAASATVKVSGPEAKKRKLGEDEEAAHGRVVVKPNDEIEPTMKLLTEKIVELIELLSVVKTWIQLKMPQVEDGGSNFGITVQEDCVSELARVEDAGFTVLESTTKYYQTRAKLVHKMTKHPLIHDYRHALKECDETQYVVLRMTFIDIRNNYAILHDLITKNLERILKPRNTEHALGMMY